MRRFLKRVIAGLILINKSIIQQKQRNFFLILIDTVAQERNIYGDMAEKAKQVDIQRS